MKVLFEINTQSSEDAFKPGKGSPPEIHAGGIWALPEWLLHPPPRTQTGTLGHFVSEKSAPNHPGIAQMPPAQYEFEWGFP